MSRGTVGDTVIVKPANNVYTVLSGVGLVVVLLGLVVVFMRASTLFDGGLFGPPTSTTTSRRQQRQACGTRTDDAPLWAY